MAIDMTVQLMPMVWGPWVCWPWRAAGSSPACCRTCRCPIRIGVRQLRLGGLLGTAPASRA